jgi:hypothetical protein
MRIIPFILTLCFASSAFAADFKVNRDDKRDSYDLGGKAKVGVVMVESAFVGDPVISPVAITVSITCLRTGTSKQVASLSAFDYGSEGDRQRLSQFDESAQTLKVFYVSGVPDETGRVAFAMNHTESYLLSGVCD